MIRWEQLLNRSLWISSIVLIGMLGAILFTPVYNANASHSSGLHLRSHHESTNEEFCVWVEDSSIAHDTVLSRVRGTLYLDNPSEDWDGLTNNKVYFIPYFRPCPDLSFRSDIEVEYWARSSGCDGLSCSWKEQPAYNPNTVHTDYRWAYVRFKTSHLTSGTFWYHHTINHETGHVLGLKDPDWWGQCADSVMHSGVYGCTDREWPSWSDRDKVTRIAENLVQ